MWFNAGWLSALLTLTGLCGIHIRTLGPLFCGFYDHSRPAWQTLIPFVCFLFFTDWSTCQLSPNAVCGSGIKTRMLDCVRSDGKSVDLKFCNEVSGEKVALPHLHFLLLYIGMNEPPAGCCVPRRGSENGYEWRDIFIPLWPIPNRNYCWLLWLKLYTSFLVFWGNLWL